MIEKKKLDTIARRIAEKFPDFKGIKPKVTRKSIPPQTKVYQKLSMGTPKSAKNILSLRFIKTVRAADAVKMVRILTVTLDERGEIIKISQSR